MSPVRAKLKLFLSPRLKPIIFILAIAMEIIGQHSHPQEKKQLRGAERLQLGEKILANHGGSSHEARMAALAANPEMNITYNQFVKCKKVKMDEEIRRLTSSTCWLRSLMDISKALASIDNKNKPDHFVHQLKIASQFSMMLQSNAQLDIKKVLIFNKMKKNYAKDLSFLVLNEIFK
jgi:hypothetical protein